MAVGHTPTPKSTADITDAFRETFSKVVVPTDLQDLHGYVSQLNTIPGEHVAAVLSAVNAATRTYFHKIVLELSEAVK